MSEDPNIVPLAEADDAAAVALWTRCGLIRPWNDPFEDIALCRASGHGTILSARDDGVLVGTAMVGHDGHRGALYYLAVDPDARRAGWGRRLVAAAEAWCRARGLPKLNLLVRKENTAVLAFYEAIGYRDTTSMSLYRNLDPATAEREVEMKAAWAARLATPVG